jgi:ATP-dependent Clp protease protease subunit
MERIDVDAAPLGDRKQRFFARTAGTAFHVQSLATGAAEIELYDEIGYWGVTAKDFRDQLKGVTGDIVLRINSPGGDVFDGIAIYNELLAHKGRVRVEVTGLAASAASVVAMAGDEIAVAENGFMMIHNAWVLAIGNRHDLTEAAGVLAKIDGALARTYANQSGMGVRTIGQMMDAETWLTGAEAKEKGFATEILGQVDAKAKFDVSVFAHSPAALSWAADAPAEPETARDIERELMRDAGPRSRSQARALMRACKHPDDATRDAGKAGLTGLLDALRQANANLTSST